MTTEQLIRVLSQLPFIAIAVVTIVQAVQRPRRSTIDIAMLFAAFAVIIVNSWVAAELDFDNNGVFTVFQVILLSALPYLLLRVVSDLMVVPRVVQRIAMASLALIIVAELATGSVVPWWLAIMIGVYFAAIGVYATRAFVHGARAARGVTSRRLYAAASGSAFLGLAIVIAVITATVSALDIFAVEVLSRALSAAVGVSYFVAFSPPRALRQLWQQPELRQLLARVAILPRLPSTALIIDELRMGAAAATGAQGAAIGLHEQTTDTLQFDIDGTATISPATAGIAGRAFSTQQAIFSENAPRDDPDNAEAYRAFHATAILAAPITAGSERLGVLTVYASRPPIFAEDDLQIVQLLADQAAVILESRALIDTTTRMQAREQATLLRDEFLTAAAHDLRTPLTALISRTQLISRRAQRQPDVPIDPAQIKLIEVDLLRLNNLIGELLDTTRAEHGQLIGNREPADVVALVQAAHTQHDWERHQLRVKAPERLIVQIDATRIQQLIHNLIENAIKYSPNGGEIRVTVGQRDDVALLAVSDDGVGIPCNDLPHIFDRFHRAENVNRSVTSGLGLGLYICRAIVEEHGGRIAVESALGRGTTFTIELPLVAEQVHGRGALETVDTSRPVVLQSNT